MRVVDCKPNEVLKDMSVNIFIHPRHGSEVVLYRQLDLFLEFEVCVLLNSKNRSSCLC